MTKKPLLHIDDWGYEERPHKPVMLNILSLKDADFKILRKKVGEALMGSGKAEWEWDLEDILFSAIEKGLEQNVNIVPITEMFSREYSRTFFMGDVVKFPQENVKIFLFKKLFDIVEETDDELTVALKEELI